MGVLFAFLLLLLVMLYLTYKTQKNDFLNPATLMIFGYIITTICSLYTAQKWKSDISLFVVFLILMGLFFFIISGILVNQMKPIRLKNAQSNAMIVEQLDNLTKTSVMKTIVVIAVCFVMTYFIYKDVLRVAYVDFKSWGNLLYNYKSNVSEYGMSFLARMGFAFTKGFAFVYLFLFMNRFSVNKKILGKEGLVKLIYLGPCIIFCVQSLMTGGRISIIMLIFAGLVYAALIKYYRTRTKWHPSIRNIFKYICFAILILLGFYYVQEMIGRMQGENSIIDYITMYLGGSIDLFSQYIRDPQGHQHYIETLAGVISNGQKYLGIFTDVAFVTGHEFRYSATGVLIGNTYTGFRSYYNDMGLFGVFLFSSILGLFFTYFYNSIMSYNILSRFKVIAIVIYASLIYCIPFHFFTDYFFTKISVGGLYDIIFIIIAVFVVYSKSNFKVPLKRNECLYEKN